MRHVLMFAAYGLLCYSVKPNTALFYILGGIIFALYQAAGKRADRTPTRINLTRLDLAARDEGQSEQVGDQKKGVELPPLQQTQDTEHLTSTALKQSADSLSTATKRPEVVHSTIEQPILEERPHKGRPRKRLIWMTVVGTIVAISISVIVRRVKDSITYTPSKAEGSAPYQPSVQVWDRTGCKREVFPGYEGVEGNDSTWGSLAHQWYCARQWNAQTFADVNQVLDKYKVSTAFSNSDHWAKMKPSPLAATSIKHFFNVFDSAVFLTMSADETYQMR